jgi:hypothetical protein
VRAPDYARPFVGWKGLIAHPDGSLWSPSFPTQWPAGEPLVAENYETGKTGAGIYFLKTLEALLEHGYNWQEGDTEDVWVIAEVSLWGRVTVGAIGYKAERAYPKKIYVPGTRLRVGRLAADRYGCDLGLIDRFTGRRY